MTKLSEIFGGLPDVSIALNGWEIPIHANFITQENIDGTITNVSKIKRLKGVVQPLRPQDLEIKPEGQRAWAWYQVHINPSYPKLRVEQIITIKGDDYKVKAVNNYIPYGYMEYHVIKDFD